MLLKPTIIFRMNRENKMQNPKIVQKNNEIFMPRKFLILKYFFFFFITVNNIILFINTPDEMEAFHTLNSPKIGHITIFLIDTFPWRRIVYYKGKFKRARRHLERFFYCFKMWCRLEGTLVRGSLLTEEFTVFL